MSLYHLAGQRLGVGSIILPGNWGRVVQKAGWLHPLAHRELALESFRLTHYPLVPSRLQCAFALLDLDEAERYRQMYCPNHAMHRVRLQDENAPAHLADALSLPNLIPFVLGWESWYWLSQEVKIDDLSPVHTRDGPPPIRELLTLSPLVVDECLD